MLIQNQCLSFFLYANLWSLGLSKYHKLLGVISHKVQPNFTQIFLKFDFTLLFFKIVFVVSRPEHLALAEIDQRKFDLYFNKFTCILQRRTFSKCCFACASTCFFPFLTLQRDE